MNFKEAVDIYISCRNLKSMDLLSKSDPYATLYYRGPMENQHSGTNIPSSSNVVNHNNNFTCIGVTETINNQNNPVFKKKFSIYYYFECEQKLKIQISDDDGNGKSDTLGTSREFSLSEVVCSREGRLKLELPFKGHVQEVFVYAEKVVRQSDHNEHQQQNAKDHLEQQLLKYSALNLNELNALSSEIPLNIPLDVQCVKFKCRGIGLDKKDFLGKSDPYFYFEKEVAGRRVTIYTSPVIEKTLNPNWSHFIINLDEFNSDYNKEIFVKCFDKDKYSKDDLIGEFCFNLNQVMVNGKKQFDLIEPELQKKKKNYKNSGVFEFEQCSIEIEKKMQPNPEYQIYRSVIVKKESRQDAFLDYLFGGCNISVSVGIDFTGSNGYYTSSSSLHYLSSSKKNQYQQALQQVLSILEPYDSDKMYGAYGYGARIKDESNMHPMFNLSLTADQEELCGAQQILEEYEKAVPKLSFGDMGSATNPNTGKPYRGDDFYRVIEHVVERTPPVMQQQQSYNILLLIIDGDSFDMQGTINSIIEANDKPISIVIVGVGSSTFPSCRKFDADDEPLKHSNGKIMTRDIVQFVRFKDCNNLEELAKEVLAEIPKQMVTYFESVGIHPNPRPNQTPPMFY